MKFLEIFPFMGVRTKPVVRPQPYTKEDPTYFDKWTHPPMRDLIPPLSTGELMERNAELIERIRTCSRRTKEEFEELYMPLIRKYAETVHYLPASEYDHHESYGGLFRHGLEVGYHTMAWAVNDAVFDPTAAGVRRKQIELLFPFAAFIAGMLHDVGKVISDINVTSEDGNVEWNINLGPITGWLVRNNLKGYLISFRKNRHESHQSYNQIAAFDILDRQTIHRIYQLDPILAEDVRMAIIGSKTRSIKLMEAVQAADMWSVEEDKRMLRGRHRGINAATGLDVIYIEAMREMLKLDLWTVNEERKGHVVWIIDGEVYLRWPMAAKWIRNYLRKNNLTAIHYSEAQILTILADRNYFEPLSRENKELFWLIAPKVATDRMPNVFFKCVKMTDPKLLFEGIVPQSTPGTIINLAAHRGNMPNLADEEEFDGAALENSADAQTSAGAKETTLAGKEAKKPSSAKPSEHKPQSRTQPSEDNKKQTQPTKADDVSAEIVDRKDLAARAEPAPLRPEQATQEAAQLSGGTLKVDPQERDSVIAWFHEHGTPGQIVVYFAEDAGLPSTNPDSTANDLYFTRGRVVVRYPGALEKRYGHKPIDILRDLGKLKWIETDPNNIGRHTRPDLGFPQSFVFTPEISKKLEAITPSITSVTSPPVAPAVDARDKGEARAPSPQQKASKPREAASKPPSAEAPSPNKAGEAPATERFSPPRDEGTPASDLPSASAAETFTPPSVTAPIDTDDLEDPIAKAPPKANPPPPSVNSAEIAGLLGRLGRALSEERFPDLLMLQEVVRIPAYKVLEVGNVKKQFVESVCDANIGVKSITTSGVTYIEFPKRLFAEHLKAKGAPDPTE
ncbi:MAG: hypothetical protein E6Q76_14460 [Rhizobium sp.]|nr:MAG: hypothetical protein E6Q76_14460 [Rhizobium sp.]